MNNILAIGERELRSYFISPLAYVVIALFLLPSGLLFAAILDQSRQASLEPLLQNVSVLFLFIVPAVSMRLVAEETRSGTIELLLTNPVQEWEMVSGKFLAALGLIVVMLVLSFVFPLFLFVFGGKPDFWPIATGYLGVLLEGAAFLSLGLWASSLTQNQIIAALLAFVMLLILWLADPFGQLIPGVVGRIVSYLSVNNHSTEFPLGVIATKDLVYYLSVIVAGLTLSTLTIQSKRLS